MTRLVNTIVFAEMCLNAFFAVCQHIPSQALRGAVFSIYSTSLVGECAAVNAR